jgi:hypothetical protein
LNKCQVFLNDLGPDCCGAVLILNHSYSKIFHDHNEF